MKKKTIPYVDFHCHSDYSILDSVSKIPDLVKAAKAKGRPAVCLTDHGTLAGLYKLHQECKKQEIKPILGIEAYFVDDYDNEFAEVDYNYGHIQLIAINETGWNNLKKLQSLAWEHPKGFHKRPRMQLTDVLRYNQGLICLTGCTDGIVSHIYLAGTEWKSNPEFDDKTEKEKRKCIFKRIRKFKKVFGDRLYAEIQLNDWKDAQPKLNKFIIKIIEKFKITPIITTDSHYIEKEDTDIHDAMKCVLWSDKLDSKDAHIYGTRNLYMHKYKDFLYDIKKYHPYISKEQCREWIRNTVKLAKRVEVYPIVPNVSTVPHISDNPDKDLLRVCKSHPEFKKLMKNKTYKKRFDYEYGIITKLGFSDYFLICEDFAKYARKNNIPYNSRGSVNGSLVSYFMKISWIEPVEFDCPFERFLTEDRLSLPDIDMDFSQLRRHEIIQYAKDKYGEEAVAHITNYGIWKPKGAIKDMGKILGYNYAEINTLTKKMEDNIKTMEDVYEGNYTEVHEFLERNEDIAHLSEKMCGIIRQQGVHASGVIITPGDMIKYCPVAYTTTGIGKNKRKDTRVTEWDMYDLEDAGILKMDFLGLSNLDIITDAIKLSIKSQKSSGKVKFTTFDELADFALKHQHDKKTYKMICSGHLIGTFQLGTSDGMMKLSKDMKPKNLDDITAIISLYRTAVLRAGMHTEFVKRRNGADWKIIHPKMEKVLSTTYGVMVYQEDTMNIAKELAGFTGTESDYFRKAIKLKDPEKFAKWKEKFVNGCKKYSDIDKKTSLKIWDFIEKFSGYGFNRAHGAAYALMAYITCYMKTHYPAEFMTSVISHNTDDDKKLSVYLNECKRMGLKVYSPHINKSTDVFKLSKNGVLYPLTAVKKVGGKAVQRLLDIKKKYKYKSFQDFIDKATNKAEFESSSPVNVGVICNLILSNSFRQFGSIEKIFDKYMKIRNDKKTFKQMYCSICNRRFPISYNVNKINDQGLSCPNCDTIYHDEEAMEAVNMKTCKGKKFDRSFIQNEVYGFSLNVNKLKRFTSQLAEVEALPISVCMQQRTKSTCIVGFEIIKIKTIIDKNQNEMAFLDISDGDSDSSITVFSGDWINMKEDLKKGDCYVGLLQVDKSRGENFIFSTYKNCYIEKLFVKNKSKKKRK